MCSSRVCFALLEESFDNNPCERAAGSCNYWIQSGCAGQGRMNVLFLDSCLQDCSQQRKSKVHFIPYKHGISSPGQQTTNGAQRFVTPSPHHLCEMRNIIAKSKKILQTVGQQSVPPSDTGIKAAGFSFSLRTSRSRVHSRSNWITGLFSSFQRGGELSRGLA